MRFIGRTAAIALLVCAAVAAAATTRSTGGRPVTRDIYGFTVRANDGTERSLAAYRGKALLVVNTASRCGFTPQYEGLEKLAQRYRARGFEVLAFPANDFLGQEPGTDAEIRSFCSLKYGNTFPLFSKIHVKGKDIAPLYAWLTRESPFPGDVSWNFAKFLVDPTGKVVARFEPKTDPLEAKLVAAVEAALPKP